MSATTDWRHNAGTVFDPEKSSASGGRGVVVANHPLASAAGTQMLALGGNAVDAAVSALFTLTVVEPMMVGVFGAGWANLRLADGESFVLDSYSTAPAAAAPDMFEPVSDSWPAYMETAGRKNTLGPLSVGVPGTLKAWTELVATCGRLDLAAVMRPAIEHAERGFAASRYLCELVDHNHRDLRTSAELARLFLPDGRALRPGELVRQPELADSLRTIAADGADALYDGPLGKTIVDGLRRAGGIMTADDLRSYRTIRRAGLTARYRGHDITVPPPPSAGGLHLLQMLRLLEGFDVAGLGFGTPAGVHLLAECSKIAFADRAAYPTDDATAARLLSDEQTRARRAGIDLGRAQPQHSPDPRAESANTTHVTAADADGNIVAATQTINKAFGACVAVPGTGILLNNTMAMFDPHPGTPHSVAPGARMASSMTPTIVSRGGRPVMALGTPGGVRIFPSVLQAVVNVIDHGMSLQEAVEAPRVWTQGQQLEVEESLPPQVRAALTALGHQVEPVTSVAGGMNGILIGDDGVLTGSACWRADGAPMAVSGGPARPGIKFRTTASRA